MTVAAAQRDLEAVHAGLLRWLRAQRPDAGDLRLAPLQKPSSGYSSETLLLHLTWDAHADAHEEHLVARLPPAGGGIFPTYDLTLQADVQAALATTAIPVAAPVAVELDESWIDAPFFLMQRAPGNVLQDTPSYVSAGLLHDADPAVQGRVQRAFVDVLADVHRLDWAGIGLGGITPDGERGLAHDIDRAEAYVVWAADGAVPTIIAESLDWCRVHRPDPEPPLSLLWGDPRLGNVVFDEHFGQVALLDWEMASIGPAEMDLAWFVSLHEVAAQSAGDDLAGFMPHDEVLAAYAARLGRPIVDYPFFEVLSLIRSDSIFLRIRTMLLAAGLDEPWLRGVTPGQRRMAALTGSPISS